MATTVEERFPSRNAITSDSSSADLHYWVSGTADPTVAEADALTEAPATYTNSIGQALVPTSVSSDQIGNELHYCVVTYGPRKYPEPGDSDYSFDTGGGTQHITQSLETMQRVSIDGTGDSVPDFKGAIGVQGDNVEGVDITTPVYHFTETHQIAAASVTNAYKALLFAATGTTNDDTFRGYDAGEVLFLGAAGSQRDGAAWEITFRFAASPNVTGKTVGDLSGINKKGWEYLWVTYESIATTDPDFIVKVPLYAHVERVYEESEYDNLGIG